MPLSRLRLSAELATMPSSARGVELMKAAVLASFSLLMMLGVAQGNEAPRSRPDCH